MRRLVVLALLALGLLAGCGTASDSAGDFDGAEADVARAVEDLEEAAQDDEPKRICDALLAKTVRDKLGGDCEKKVQEALDRTDTFALTVESVRVSGNSARARVETGVDEEQVELLELVKEDGGWRIAALPQA